MYKRHLLMKDYGSSKAIAIIIYIVGKLLGKWIQTETT